MLTQEDIDSAKQKQAETWRTFSQDFVFFRDTTTPVPEDIWRLPNYDGLSHYHRNFDSALSHGYPLIARYWATNFLEYHLAFLWCRDYGAERSSGAKEKDAQKFADAERARRTKELKKRYP